MARVRYSHITITLRRPNVEKTKDQEEELGEKQAYGNI